MISTVAVDSIETSIPTFVSPKHSCYEKRKAKRRFCKHVGDRSGDRSSEIRLPADAELPQGYPRGRHRYTNGSSILHEAFDEQNSLSSFALCLKTLVGSLEDMLFGNDNKNARRYSIHALVV